MGWKPPDNSWKLAHGNAAGRLWRYIDSQLCLSKKHLKKVRKGKFKPGVTIIDFKDWYKN
jgi:hypothetical protein